MQASGSFTPRPRYPGWKSSGRRPLRGALGGPQSRSGVGAPAGNRTKINISRVGVGAPVAVWRKSRFFAFALKGVSTDCLMFSVNVELRWDLVYIFYRTFYS
jgi:hypothetical protein